MKKWFPEALVGCAILMVVSYGFAQSWTQTSAPVSPSWEAVAASADGSKIMVVNSSSNPVFSTNSGVAWITNADYYAFNHVASSADGSRLVGVFATGFWYVYLSNDSGRTWFQTGLPQANWSACAASADGTKLFVTINGGPICGSTNSGATWFTNGAPINTWKAIVSSADGSKLAAAAYNDTIYTSTDAGLTWSSTSAPAGAWYAIASSADERQLVATGRDIGTYISTNSGSTWTFSSSINGSSVASSADGTKLVICNGAESIFYGGVIFTSTNSGVDWISNTVPDTYWSGVATSADGCKLVAVGQGVWTWQTTPSPQLNLASSSNNVTLSWLLPSTDFAVQQSPDLISWASITDAPALNLNNLNNELSLSPSNSSGFFRLISQ